MSGKHERLMAVRDLVRVPATVLLDESFFRRAVDGYDELDRALDHLLEEIVGTSGAFLGEHAAELAALLADLRLAADGPRLLAEALATSFTAAELARGPFAVRSAAPHEDGERRSFAGLYLSKLGVAGLEGIAAAALEVWASYFSYPALLERLTAGVLAGGGRMSVMVQPLVAARWSGVCFTADPLGESPGAVVELVEGLGDGLLAGEASGLRLSEAEIRRGGGPEAARPALAALLAAVEALSARCGGELDVEWAWDGRELFVLQVRPIATLAASAPASAEPTLTWTALYAAAEEALAAFAPLPEFARYFRAKRGPLYRFAREQGVATGKALIVRFDRAGLAVPGAVEALLAAFSSAELVIDAHASYRQRILARAAVAAELRALVPRRDELRTVVVRDYLRGGKGFISRALTGGTVVYEVAEEGLLALNRGTAPARSFRLPGEAATAPELPPAATARFVAATRAARERFGPCQLEWVQVGEGLFIVDYSPLDDPLPAFADRRVVSPGFAAGPVLRLEDGEGLRRLSEGPAVSLAGLADAPSSSYLRDVLGRVRAAEPKPIVVAPRPFAILATLIPHVGGFVFERASTLCHLAILLREHGVPAIESPESYAALVSGDRVTVDAHGASHLAEVRG